MTVKLDGSKVGGIVICYRR